jgi:hypothetical protein
MRIKWIRDKVGELSSSLARIRQEAERSDQRLAQEISYVADDLAVCAKELDIVVKTLLARLDRGAAKEAVKDAVTDAVEAAGAVQEAVDDAVKGTLKAAKKK